MSKSNVLTVYYKPVDGGLCKRLTRGMKAILEEGHVLHYLSTKPFDVTHTNCTFHRFWWPPTQNTDSYLFWAIFHIVAPFQLAYIAKKNTIDTSFVFANTYALLLQPTRIFLGIPLKLFLRADAITNHQLNAQPKWLIIIETFFEGLAITGVDIVGVSGSLVESVRKRNTRLKTKSYFVLRNDLPRVDVQQLREPFRSRILRFSCIANLETRKNQELLIEAVKGIDTDETDFRLNFYGEGSMRNELQSKVDLVGLEKRLTLAGWKTQAHIWSNTDIVLLPSLHEGAPNAVLEGLVRRIAILASDIPEHREILPSECLVSVSDKSAWTKRIVGILEKPEKACDLVLAQECSRKKLMFDWDSRFVDIVVGNYIEPSGADEY